MGAPIGFRHLSVAMRGIGLLAILVLLAPALSWGEAPALTYLFPQGARQGSTVTVTLGAKDLPPEARLWVEGEGISARGPIKEGKVELAVAKAARPGVRKLRVITPQGASVPRPFV